MNKKLFNERLEILKTGGEVQVSKKGNFYIKLSKNTGVRTLILSPNNITKSQLKKGLVMTENNYPLDSADILLLTKDNKVYFKHSGLSKYSPLGIKHLREIGPIKIENILANMFFHNKKANWLKEYPNLWIFYKLLRSFSSKEELLAMLEVDEKITLNLNADIMYSLILGFKIKDKESVIKADEYHLRCLVQDIARLNLEGLYSKFDSFEELEKALTRLYKYADLKIQVSKEYQPKPIILYGNSPYDPQYKSQPF